MSDWGLGGIAALGAFHGLNPAMGWLFGVAIGMQHASRKAVALALVPIAIGHAASVGLTVLLVEELRVVASDTVIRASSATLLVAVAAWKLFRGGHLRWVGFNISIPELGLRSFLMSSAHGAGLMLIPLLMGTHLRDTAFLPAGVQTPLVAIAVHTLAMIAVAGGVAALIYEVVGVGVLRRGWVNFDRVWVFSLLVGAAVTLISV